MKTYVVMFGEIEVNDTPSQYIDEIEEVLSNYESTKIVENVWIIKTRETTGQIRSKISNLTKDEYTILVLDLNDSSWSGYNLAYSCKDWLNENL